MKVDISKLTGITISPVNKEEDGKSDPGNFQGLDLSVTKVERPLRSGRSPRSSHPTSPRRFNPKDPAISPRRSSPRACFSPKSAHNTSISSFDSRESLNQSTDSLNAFSFEADELRKDMAYEEAIESAIARGMRESH